MDFLEKVEKIYEKKKDVENPPSYIRLIERLIELEKADEGI